MLNMDSNHLIESMLSICIINDDVMNEENDEVERRILPTKQIKISIKLSFHCFVMHCLYLVTVL